MLQPASELPSFLRPNNILLYVENKFCLSTGCFHLWVITNNAVMDTDAHISVLSLSFQFFGVYSQKWNYWIIW